MRINLIVVGKTDSKEIERLTNDYVKRLGHYLPFDLTILPDVKRSSKTNEGKQKEDEGEQLLKQLSPRDKLFLFDERGKEFSSVGFADFIQDKMIAGEHRLVFVIGGPYGFSEAVYQRANGKISLSKMTFSHQMVRLFAVEQIYRAMTILRGEPYHHE